MLPLQQPLGHEVASHKQAPFTHCCPFAHCAPPPHVHPPLVHPSATVVLQVVHAAPFAPQFATEGTSQVVPEQHPDVHVCEHVSQTPLTHESPPGHAAHLAPLAPHDEADSDAYGSQVLPLQQPCGHDVPLHTQVPPTHT